MKTRFLSEKEYHELYQISLSSLFLSQVIGSVTTYLVILIQVGDLSNGNFTISNSSITNFTVPDILTIDV
jgi:hypothetical protein